MFMVLCAHDGEGSHDVGRIVGGPVNAPKAFWDFQLKVWPRKMLGPVG